MSLQVLPGHAGAQVLHLQPATTNRIQEPSYADQSERQFSSYDPSGHSGAQVLRLQPATTANRIQEPSYADQ